MKRDNISGLRRGMTALGSTYCSQMWRPFRAEYYTLSWYIREVAIATPAEINTVAPSHPSEPIIVPVSNRVFI